MNQQEKNFEHGLQGRRNWWRTCGLASAFVVMTAAGIAQSHPVSPSLPTLPSGVPANARQDYDIPSTDYSEEERRMRTLNAARQHEIKSDVNKMVKLAAELNADLASSKGDSLTRAQLHKLGQIEKLARDVKEKMIVLMNPGLQPSDVRP